jgi:hypothetical protein
VAVAYNNFGVSDTTIKSNRFIPNGRDQASLGDSGSGSGATAASSGLAAAQKVLHRAGSSLTLAAGEAPSLAALSQLGQSSLETLRSKATGLFGKLGGGPTDGGGGGGSGVGAGGAPSPGTHEVSSFLKGTVLSVAKRAEQAMEARGVKVPAVPSFGTAGGANSAAGAGAGGGGGGGGVASPSLEQHQQQPSPAGGGGGGGGMGSSSPSVFVIEDDEAEEDEDGNENDWAKKQQAAQAPSPPPQAAAGAVAWGVSGKRTSDVDRELALKLHALNGLQKGQEVEVSPEALPGAQLFSVYKQKPAAATGGGEEAGGDGAAVRVPGPFWMETAGSVNTTQRDSPEHSFIPKPAMKPHNRCRSCPATSR